MQRDLFRLPRTPWNSGRLIGPKAPFKPKHVWAIRQQLKSAKRVRDLALFNCAIDAKLRGCDLVKLRVSDVAPGGVLRQRSTVIQQKTGRPVPFEITEPTREALAAWLERRGGRPDDWLFPSRSRPGHHIGTRQYARLVDRWVAMVELAGRRLRNPQPEPHKGGPGLQEDRQSARVPTPAGSPQIGEHRQILGHRGGRRARDVRANRALIVGGSAFGNADPLDFRNGWTGDIKFRPSGSHEPVALRGEFDERSEPAGSGMFVRRPANPNAWRSDIRILLLLPGVPAAHRQPIWRHRLLC
jgi:hypothetical protein